MSARTGVLARLVLRVLRRLLPGELGAEAVAEIEAEHRSRRETRGGHSAFPWLIAHLFMPGTWLLAVRLRARRRLGSGRATTPRGAAAELRHSVRGLLRRPGFAVVTAGTLAVGIGAATAVFSLAEAMLLRPLAVDESARLVRLFSTNPTRGLGRFEVSYPDYAEFTAREDLFESASFYLPGSADVSGDGDPERVVAVAVHRGFFDTLGTPPVAGRLFDTSDHAPGSTPSAILSESFWERRFGGDHGAVGETIRLDGEAYLVVGVVPDDSSWPAGAQVWTPLQWGAAVPDAFDERSDHSLQVLARLARGAEVDGASRQVDDMARAIYARSGIDPRDEGTGAIAVPLHSSESGEGAGVLFTTLGTAVLLVLLLACMNASGLLLLRARTRERELAVRAALGASRARLGWVLLGETATLAVLGGVLGVVLGNIGLRAALGVAPAQIADLADVRLNAMVVGASLGVVALATLMAGVLPAIHASRVPLAGALKEGEAARSGDRASTRLRRGMVVVQVALALTMLVAAGLAVRGVQRQLAADPGFAPNTLVSFTVRLPEARYAEGGRIDAFFAEAVDRLAALPSVRSATVTSRLPLGAGGLSVSRSFGFENAPPPPNGPEFGAAWVEVDPGYFETMGVAPVAGRAFDSTDRADGAAVAIVNERMARLMSPDEPLVGRRIRAHYGEDPPRTVVGVVPDIQLNGVSRDQRLPAVFVPRGQAVRSSMAFLVRTEGDPVSSIQAIRTTMAELDPDVALAALQPLRSAHASDLGGIRFLTILFGAFGGLAFVLAISGVYGVVAYSMSRRTRELGIRVAIGIAPRRLTRGVVRDNLALGGLGMLIGMFGAYGAGRVLESGMDGVAMMQASTFVMVALALGAAVLVATWIPAARATRVDPMTALRSE